MTSVKTGLRSRAWSVFKAILGGEDGEAPTVELPFDVKERFGKMRAPVRGTVNGTGTLKPLSVVDTSAYRPTSRTAVDGLSLEVPEGSVFGLLGGTLVHELPVDGCEDSLLALPEPWVGLGRLNHRHHRLLHRHSGAR